MKLVSANLHNEPRAVSWLRRRSHPNHPEHYDVAMVSEAHKRHRALTHLPGHQYLTGPTRGPSREVGILLSRSLPLLGHGYQFLSPAAPKFARVGKERWGQVALTEYGDTPIAVVALHPVAGPKALHGDDPDHPLVERYAEAMRWLEATIVSHTDQGHEVIAGGDLQMKERARPLWSPRHIFANHNMRWLWEGIDVLAWTRGLELAGPTKTRVIRDFPSDHPALSVQLEPIRRKPR